MGGARVRFGRTAAAAASVVATLVATPAFAHAALSAQAPAGFDALERPQTTLVDVYFGGVRIASTLARYTPGSLTFLRPVELAAAVPRLKADPRVLASLGAELPANAAALCGEGAADGCGRLSPGVAGVIFDEARFRADLFVNPAFLDVATPLADRYLPAPVRTASAVSLLGGVVSGASDGRTAYGLDDRTVLSIGEVRVAAEVSQSSGDGFRAETAAVSLDRGGLRYAAGLLLSPALDFLGQARVVGASVGTQLDTLENRDIVSATPLLVYLQARTRVEAYRGARLLAAQTYEAGNQQIDTSAFPDGAYEVVLRLREAGGAVREERRFFTRSRRLPPLGRPQFQITVGALTDAAAGGAGGDRAVLAQVDYARRINRNLALEGSGALVGGDGLFAAGASWIGEAAQLRTEATLTTAGEGGVLVGAALNLGARARLALDVRQTWGVHPEAGRVAAAEAGDAQALAAGAAPLPIGGFGGGGTQAAASLSASVRGVLVALNGSFADLRGARASYAVGGSVDAPLGLGRLQNLRVYASAAETDRGPQVYVGLRFHLARGRAALFGEAAYAHASGGAGAPDGPIANLAASREITTRAGEANLAASYTHAEDRDALSGSAIVRGSAGEAGATLEQDLRGPSTATRYSASFAVGAAVSSRGVSVGDAGAGESGVVVSVTGPPGAAFRVMIDDAPAGRVVAGRSLSLFLPAYRVYHVRLAPLDGAPLAFDTAERQVSLFPGNVARLQWAAAPELEVFGRVLDARGAPLANAVIAGGSAPAATDAAGWFQASLSAERALTFTAAGGSCVLRLEGLSSRDGYAALGTRTCPLSPTPVPAARTAG